MNGCIKEWQKEQTINRASNLLHYPQLLPTVAVPAAFGGIFPLGAELQNEEITHPLVHILGFLQAT